MTETTVVVVGAGMAGLKAATDLTAAGISVQVLEARSRLGGRLFSEETPSGQVIDIGASWFHDCLNNPLLEKYYKKLNKGKTLEFEYDDFGIDFFDADGKIDIESTSIEQTRHELITYLKVVCGALPQEEDISIRDACLKYLKEKAYAMTPEQLKYTHQIFRYIECFGSSWENMSARQVVNSGHLGRDLLLLNGYKTVYDGETEELLALVNKKSVDELLVPNNTGVQFNLGTEVCGISKNYTTGKIEVTTKNKGVFTCDYVVVTTPLAVLKVTDPKELGCITWNPPLPKYLRDSIQSAGDRNLGKLFLEFDEQFWPDTCHMFAIADEDLAFNDALFNDVPLKPEVLAAVTSARGSNPTPIEFINVAAVMKKKYGSVKTPMIAALTSEHFTKKLEICYRNGDMDAIHKLISPALARVSEIPVDKVPKPKFIRMTEWAYDPYSRGSYTGTAIGQPYDYFEIVDNMINPRGIFGESGVSRVRFAGEGTVAYGARCAHGAWLSGQREAQVIVNSINKPKL